MFTWFSRKTQPIPGDLRDTLFGDQDFSDWASQSIPTEPWVSFTQAKNALDSGDLPWAIEFLQGIVAMPNLESRYYLQAWHFLREWDVNPPPERAKQFLGLIVEVSLPQGQGLDLLAAYSDHHARYYNFSGAGVVWERPNDLLDSRIDELLTEAGRLAAAIGPWDKPRPPAPPKGYARINILTPSGLHFGQAPIEDFAKDPLGRNLFQLSFEFMQVLMRLDKSALKA